MLNPNITTNPSADQDGATTTAEFTALSQAVRAGTLPLPGVCDTFVNIDTNLLALWEEYQTLRAKFRQIGDDPTDEQLDVLGMKNDAIVDNIRAAHAISVWGLLIKLRVAAAEMHGEPNGPIEELFADIAVQFERQIGRLG